MLAVMVLFWGTPAAHCQSGPEISTEELKVILADGQAHVFDVRPAVEFAISHIPGSINIYENEIERMTVTLPGKKIGDRALLQWSLLPQKHRVAEQLIQKGYSNVKRFQQGLPVWRAFGNPAETDLAGFKYVFSKDKSAVFIDARQKGEFDQDTVPGAVNMKPDEAEQANKDGRLPYTDHGARIIVFGSSAAQARQLAEEIAHRAYWNSSFFSGTYQDLKKAGIW